MEPLAVQTRKIKETFWSLQTKNDVFTISEINDCHVVNVAYNYKKLFALYQTKIFLIEQYFYSSSHLGKYLINKAVSI